MGAALVGSWPPLAGLADSLGEVRLRYGKQATVRSFRELAPDASLIHVAAHAEFRRDNPMFSCIHLHDESIAAWELALERLSARVAILSACSTGKVVAAAGDEILGLARGLMAAGVPTLVLSHWRISDPATMVLMRNLYGLLGSGHDAREALHRATLATRDEFPHPYYWAAFQLLGRPGSRVVTRRSRRRRG